MSGNRWGRGAFLSLNFNACEEYLSLLPILSSSVNFWYIRVYLNSEGC